MKASKIGTAMALFLLIRARPLATPDAARLKHLLTQDCDDLYLIDGLGPKPRQPDRHHDLQPSCPRDARLGALAQFRGDRLAGRAPLARKPRTMMRPTLLSLCPGLGVLHMEFTGRGEQLWLSVRDGEQVQVWNPYRMTLLKTLPALSPSGIFFSNRAQKMGY